MRNCLKCNSETTNPTFCSRSCAASYNNTKSPKRQAQKRFCFDCQSELLGSRKLRYCTSCRRIRQATTKISPDETLGSYLKRNNYIGPNRFVGVRGKARIVARSLGIYSCQNCGYDKHVEVCHITPINSFSLDTMLSVINSIDNILILCPNCHWEFDNGLLKP
jgi:5-methylcytosine-specific restriction endonuclease McrA